MRFPGFEGEWEERKLGEISKIYDGTHQTPNYVDVGIPFYSVEHITSNNFNNTKYISKEVYLKEIKRVQIDRGDILMTRIGDIGTSKYVDWDVNASFYVSLALIKSSQHINSKYLNHSISSPFFQRELWNKTIHVAFPKKINLGEIGNCKIKFPGKMEQEKISTFLSLIDSRMSTQNKIIEQLETLIRDFRNQIFEQKLRFKNNLLSDFREWDIVKLGEIAYKKNLKNKELNIRVVFSNSASLGITNQTDLFDKEIANQNNIDGYYIVEKNDFVYNPRISKEAPVGPISRNKIGIGVMSPLYIVIGFKQSSVDFFELFFKSNVWNEHMESIANYGARADRMSFSNSDFFEMPIPIPSIEEQNKISNFLYRLEQKIEIEKQILKDYRVQKQYLLQNIFM